MQLTEYELMIASHLVDPNDITVTWSSIGGLGHVIQEIKETIILPVKRKDLFADSQLTQPPKGKDTLKIVYIIFLIYLFSFLLLWRKLLLFFNHYFNF